MTLALIYALFVYSIAAPTLAMLAARTRREAA